ncbi:MAG: hypothetical protein ACOC97_05525 [Myxococcota bacterium]
MAHLGKRTFGPAGKTLAALTDAELAEEAQRRRRARGAGRDGTAPRPIASGAERTKATPERVRQWYANLELREGATLDQVEEAYERMVRRYDPERHREDPDRHRAAVALVRSLTRAYRGLVDHLRGSRATPRP